MITARIADATAMNDVLNGDAVGIETATSLIGGETVTRAAQDMRDRGTIDGVARITLQKMSGRTLIMVNPGSFTAMANRGQGVLN